MQRLNATTRKGWGEGIWKSGIKSATYQVLPSAVGCQGHYTQSSKLLVARTAGDINGPPGVASDLDRGGDDDVETSAAVMMEMEMALAPVDWRWCVYLCALLQRLNSNPARLSNTDACPRPHFMVHAKNCRWVAYKYCARNNPIWLVWLKVCTSVCENRLLTRRLGTDC